jgi:Domain of unknown function (DUF4917)
MAGEPDGSLHDWRDVADAHKWEVLLLGNGLSINVWEDFGYRRLYDHAKQGKLSPADRQLFASTPNFERVLGDLRTAIRVNELYKVETRPILARYRSIQGALMKAVREVHVPRVPEDGLDAINGEIRKFKWVFTTSYDLIVYWAMAATGFEPFMDHFRWANRCQFDPRRAKVAPGKTPVYFLHGALHLVVGSSGETWKLTQRGLNNILDQFGKSIRGDRRARPLVVSEGSAADKLIAIEDNVYLSHALEVLAGPRTSGPAVVFGSSFGETDGHLAAALSEHRDRPIAISMVRSSKEEQMRKQLDIKGQLPAGTDPLFFDAATHPLGDPALRVPKAASVRHPAPWRPPPRRRGMARRRPPRR